MLLWVAELKPAPNPRAIPLTREDRVPREEPMKDTYLEVTYRKGRILAAYYYLPRRDGDTRARTEPAEEGLVVDFSEDGRPIGVEITAPSCFDRSQFNRLLERLGCPPADEKELAPLAAA